MANDDAINDFAPEESGEPRSAQPNAAEPHASSADVHGSSSRDGDVRERVPEVDFEELFSQIDSGELAPPLVDFEPASQIDFDQLADIYASPSSPEVVAPAPEVDGAVSADVYASPAPEVDGTAVADTYRVDSAAPLNAWPGDNGVMYQRPAPYESSGGVQVLAALATVGMLTIMYAVFVNERSSPLSIPSRVTAPASTPTSAPEAEQLASLEPPLVSDAVITPPPSVRPRPYFDDPFGLTRGLGPSIPLQGFDVPPRSAAADNATPPATEPVPPAVSAPAAAAPEPPPRATPAPTPPVATPPPAAPPTVTSSPPATASVPRNPAPPTTSAPSSPGAPAPSIAGLATPTPAAEPVRSAPAPAAPAAASAPAASAVVENNQTGIQNTLARYRKAFSALNASAAREVWPTVNERSLSRAFDRLEQQDVSFDRCQIEVTNNDRAEATCNGTASYVPRVGSRTPRVDQREWRFNLVKVKDQWLIGAVDAR